MTLTEYINQADPVRHPNVILAEDEFISHAPIKAGNHKLTTITIPVLHTKYDVSGNYIQFNDQKDLYTADDQGNISALSVFKLP